MIKREDDGSYTATHITGPTHNLLRLRLCVEPRDIFTVRVLPPVGEYRHHDGLTADDVIPSIRSGVARANAEQGTNFSVEHAEIIEDDSRYPAAYEILAIKIIRAAAEAPH
ncbi:hypothetical protein [Sphingopyxis sp. 22461]|uniref:hypothetical protein n=1 Tax=Sphingopyxis sp. 22461 TaxID=3453923 RepID=UPI003F82D539